MAEHTPGFNSKPPRKKATGRKRDVQVKLWLSNEEVEKLDDACSRFGKTRAQLLVDFLDGARSASVCDHWFIADVTRLQSEIARCGNSLNQIALQSNRIAKRGPDPCFADSFAKIGRALDDASVAVNSVIGRFLGDE